MLLEIRNWELNQSWLIVKKTELKCSFCLTFFVKIFKCNIKKLFKMLCCLEIVTKFLVKFSKLLMSFSNFLLVLLILFLVNLYFKELIHINNCFFQIFHLLSNDTNFVIANSLFVQLLSILGCRETFLKVMKCWLIIFLVLIVLSNFLIDNYQIGRNILNLFLKSSIDCFV